MNLNSDTVLNVYITPKAGYTVSVSTTFNGKTYEGVRQSNGRYRVRIPGISAHLLGNMLNITGTASDGENSSDISIKVSPLSYAYTVLNNEAFDTDAKNAMAAFYGYYDAVIMYNAT